jgi:hypothetical protein
MNHLKIKEVCNSLIQQHIDRMHILCDQGKICDAESVYSEIRDWVIQKDDLKVLSLAYIGEHFEDS